VDVSRLRPPVEECPLLGRIARSPNSCRPSGTGKLLNLGEISTGGPRRQTGSAAERPLHPAPLHALEHFLHAQILLEELIDLLDRGARSPGDALLARAVEDFRPAALVGGHRAEDGLD